VLYLAQASGEILSGAAPAGGMMAHMRDVLASLSSGVLRVAVGGEPVIEHCAGATGGAESEPCSPETRFQIASVSKQFTAAAVLVLVQQGQLSAGDRVARWFPGRPDGWDAVTVHQLLSHTSGLGHWEDFPEINIFAPMSDEQMLGTIQARPLLGAPGTRFCYSSLGYWLLAQIVEKVSGQPYAQFLTQRVLQPAGLADTFAGAPRQRPHVASGHTNGLLSPSYELDHTGKGAGDIYSTAEDLDQWSRSLPALLAADWSPMMFTGHASAGHSVGSWGNDDAYGYGWYLHNSGSMTLCYHSGHNSGFNSINAWIPERHLSLVILTNDDSIDPQAIAQRLVEQRKFL
jgi:CubicO group peptidase (beta-lactamase class C family)